MNELDQGSATPEVVATDPVNVDTHAEGSAPEENAGAAASPKPERPEVPRSVMNRIGALTRQKEAVIREAAQWKERAEALERQYTQPNQQTQQREPQVDQNKLFAHAREQAAFDLKCNAVAKAGEAIPGFDGALSNLAMVGLDQGSLSVLIEADDAPKLLAYLGQHLDEAAEILALPPVAMARRIAKLEAKLATAPAMSTAPDPLKPVRTASTKSEPQPGTKEWAQKRNKERIEKYGHP